MRWLLKTLDWANRWLTPAFSGAAAVLGMMWQNNFAALRIKYPNWPGLFDYIDAYVPPLFILCFVLAGACSLFGIFTRKSICRLEKQLQSEREKVNLIAENIEALINGLLLKLSERIGFSKGEPSRLTIYIHNENGHFISFGRYSPDPSYGGKGRNLLPDNKGCISQAWSADLCYEGNIGHRESQKKYHITKDEYEVQRMKAVFFAVKRIDTSNKKPLAVIVLESKTPNKFRETEIKAMFDKEEAYLAEIIGCLKNHIPNPQDAAKRGF